MKTTAILLSSVISCVLGLSASVSAQPRRLGAFDGSDLKLQYVCDNTFRVVSTAHYDIVAEVDVAGVERNRILVAGTNGQSETQRSLFQTTRTGTVHLYVKGELVATKENGHMSCAPLPD